jgi:hypothetical protein
MLFCISLELNKVIKNLDIKIGGAPKQKHYVIQVSSITCIRA